MMLDLFNNIEIRQAIAPDEGAGSDTAKTSAGIDLANVCACIFAIATGALVDADATFTTLIEDSPDNSVWTAVDDAFLQGTEALASFTFANDAVIRKIGYIGPQRYVRITITPASNTGAWDICAVALLAHHRLKPQSSQSN